MAAALAYRAIFAVAPLLLLAVGVFGLVIGDSEEARAAILSDIARLAGQQVAGAVDLLVVSAVRSGDVTTVVGVVLFVWTSSTLFMEVQNSLNDVFGVPSEKTAGFLGFVRRRAIAIAWSLSFGLLLAFLWLFNSAWYWIASLLPDGLAHFEQLLGWVARLLSLLVLPGLFYLMFRTMTRAAVRRRAKVIGSLFTSVVFLLTAVGVGVYFSWDADTAAPQIAGSFFIVLLSAYVLSAVMLFGAQVIRAYDDRLQGK